MKKTSKIMIAALAAGLLLGLGAGAPYAENAAAGSLLLPPRTEIAAPGENLLAPIAPPEDPEDFYRGRFEPTPPRIQVITGRFSTPLPPPSDWSLPVPGASPSPRVSPTPAPSRKSAISSGFLFALYGPDWGRLSGLFGSSPDHQEVIVTNPDWRRTRRTVYSDPEYNPAKKTLSYPLLLDAYRLVYRQLFGIALTTPTPVLPPTPSPTLTPEDYKTPPPSPTRTPKYCSDPLKIIELGDMRISRPRSENSDGWGWYITAATAPANQDESFGYTEDNSNTYYSGIEKEIQPASILFRLNQTGPMDVQKGDWATLTYYGEDGRKNVRVYPPAVASSDPVYYFIAQDGSTYTDRWLCNPAGVIPTPTPLIYGIDSGDYDGDGSSDVVIFRPSSGLWAIRGITRTYFGKPNDLPVSGDYNGDGTTDIAIFQGSFGLWAVRGQTRLYFGAAGDIPVPGDYNGDGICEPGIFRSSSGLWTIRSVTRVYFGKSSDRPVPGYYRGKGPKNIAVFRPSTGLWAMRGLSRIYCGGGTDWPVPSDYTGDQADNVAIFRPTSSLWAVQGVTRSYFGRINDRPVNGDFSGSGTAEIGIFRESSGLWAIRGVSKVYYGKEGDLPLGAPPCRLVTPTPNYCRSPLEMERLEDMLIANPRAGETEGWTFRITRAAEPIESFGYGFIRDSEGVFFSEQTYTSQPTAILISDDDEAYTIQTGDYLTLTYDSLQFLDVYLPPLSGTGQVYYYIAADGSTYSDRWLCQPAGVKPSPTPEGYKTATPTPSPTATPTPPASPSPSPASSPTATPSPTPIGFKSPSPVPSSTPSPSPTHSPSPTPSPTPTPIFNLVGTIEVGSPIWSLWADDFYLYAGTEGGSVHIWKRGLSPEDFSLQTRIVGDSSETIYGLAGYPGTDPHRLYSSSSKGRMYAWEYQVLAEEWTRLTAISHSSESAMNSVAADNLHIAGAGNNGLVYIWKSSNFSLQTVLDSQAAPVVSVSLDESYVYSGGGGGMACRWGRQTAGASFDTFTASSIIVWATDVDEDFFYTGGFSPALTGWPYPALTPSRIGGNPPGDINSLSSDQRSYISGVGGNGDLYVWSTDDLSLKTVSPGSDQSLNSVFADRYRDGVSHTRYIYGGGKDGNIYFWLGERTPTPIPTPSITPTPSTTPSITPTATPIPTPSVTPTYSPTPSPSPTATPSPTLTPSPTPICYKPPTPSITPTPSPSPSATPTLAPYCNDALKISKLEGLWIAHTHSDQSEGWYFRVAQAEYPEEPGYGYIYDNENSFNLQSTYEDQPVALLVSSDVNNFTIQTGDYLTLTYDSLHDLDVYLPPISGTGQVYYYIAADGSTYSDRWLCQTAAVAPTPGGGGGAKGAGSAPGALSAEPSFDLVGMIEVGPPVWSVWADERYLYGGTGDGSVYIWERGPGGFYFQGSIGGYSEGNIYGLAGYRGLFQRRLYGASEDGTVYAWDFDLRSGGLSLLASLDQGLSFMYSVAADRELICGANNDGGVYVWSAADFSLQTVLDRGEGPALSVSLDNDYIYGGFADGVVFLWDRETLAPANAFSASTDIVWATAVDRDYIYAGGTAPALAGWAKSDFSLFTGKGDPPGPVAGLSSDQRDYLAGAGSDGSLYVWSVPEFSLQTVSRASTEALNSVFADRYRTGEVFPHFIYGASADGNIYVWRGGPPPTPTPTPSIPPSPIPPASATPDNYRTPPPTASATPTPFRSLRTPTPPAYPRPTAAREEFATPAPRPSPTFGTRIMIDPTPSLTPVPSPSSTPADFSLLAVLEGGQGWMMGVFVDGDYIYGAQQDNHIYLWDVEDYRRVTSLTVPECRAMLSVFADADYIYGANEDSRIYAWDRKNFGLRNVLGDGRYYVESLFADRDYLYGANYDGGLYLWDREEFNLQTRLAGPRGWLSSVSADEKRIYAGSGGIDHMVSVWDRSNLDLLRDLTGAGDDINAVWADEDYIYGASADGNVYLWNTRTLSLQKILTQPVDQVTAVISRGPFIYASSLDHGLYVWEKDGFALYRVLDEIAQPLQGMFVEGGRIFAAGRDGKIYVWQAPSSPKAAATPSGVYPYPPVPPDYPDSGLVVQEFLSAANENDRDGGIAWKDGYLYENTGEDNILYQRDPVDGKLAGGVTGLQTARDMGIAWDPDNDRWYIADPWVTGISVFAEISPGSYDLSVPSQGNVAGLFYDSQRRRLLSANTDRDHINVWSTDPAEPLALLERIAVGFPQNGVAAVGDLLWVGLHTDAAYAPVYELDRLGAKTGRQFVLPEGRHAGDMTWDGECLWVRSDYRQGNIKLYRVDIAAAELSETAEGAGEGESAKAVSPAPTVATPSPRSRPTPVVFEWVPPTEPYDPAKKSLDYSLLQDAYKQVYLELFDILLTTPTPPPTPIPTATPAPAESPSESPGAAKKVVINEIAWGGSFNSALAQWIELYNTSDATVNLSGWKISNTTSGWTVNLSGNIAGGAFYVLYVGTAPDGKGDLKYDEQMKTGGDSLSLIDFDGKTADTVNCATGWFAGAAAVSMERKNPSDSGNSLSNWADSQTSSGVNRWTPRAANSVATGGGAYSASGKAASGLDSGGGAGGKSASPPPNLSLWEYADWIDFASGRYFKIYGRDRAGAEDKTALFDYLPNAAFIYLVTGYRPTGRYFKESLLDLVRDASFDWGGKDSSRHIADLAESFLALVHTGLFSEEERVEVREKFYRLALDRRKLSGEGHYGQGVICGLNAVAGYLVGGERGAEMIDWAGQLLSYDDTWTIPENSRHYGGIFLQEMLRVALYSNRMTIPETDQRGRNWKRNFARQIQWIIETSPHNGFSPAWGREYDPNHLGHFMAPLAVATTVLDDGDSEHRRLAGEAKWLLGAMFNYASTHRVGDYNRKGFGYRASQWGPFAVLFNPVYLFWFLNEGLAPLPPAAGSLIVYRPMLAKNSPDGVYDRSLPGLVTQPDRIVHRAGGEGDALFLALDPAYPAAKSGENKYSFANNLLSLSYGPEEFLTGLTNNHLSGDKTRANLADILSNYIGAELVSWSDSPELSRSVTRLQDGGRSWTREVTLYKTTDRRIEVRDTLSRRGNVYWHFSGRPTATENGVVLTVNGTELSVSWEGAERVSRRDRSTWADPDPDQRWTYTASADHEIKLYISTPGTIVTTFRGR